MAGIIFLQNRGVYQFSTARNSTNTISLLAGTDTPFQKGFYGGITLYRNIGFDTSTNPSQITLDNHGIQLHRGLFQYKMGTDTTKHPYINSDLIPTCSISTFDQLLASGSLYIIHGSGSHQIELPAAANQPGVAIKIFKNSPNTSSITIKPGGMSTINAATSKSCSDPYCSVELIALHGDPGWAIVSSIGTWT